MAKRRSKLGAVEMLTLPRRKRPYRLQRAKPDVRVAYGAVLSKNFFMPAVWINGRRTTGETRQSSRDRACAMARDMAKEEIDHYSGDWNILFVDRCARGSRRGSR